MHTEIKPALPSNSTKHIEEYVVYLKEEGRLAPLTIDTYRSALRVLNRRLEERGVSLLRARKEDIIKDINEAERRGAKINSIALWMHSTKRFFDYLIRNRIVDENPATPLLGINKKVTRSTPRRLSADEMNAFLSVENYPGPKGRRNLLMFKILATTPLKVGRVCALKLSDIDLTTGMGPTMRRRVKKKNIKILVRLKEPLLNELRNYVANDLPDIVLKRKTDYLFPSSRGSAEGRLTRQAVWHALKLALKRAGVLTDIRTKDLPTLFT